MSEKSAVLWEKLADRSEGENKMEDMLDMLYHQIEQESKAFIEKSREMEMIIREKVKASTMDDVQREDVKTLMYDFLGIAQEVYFKLGFRYGVRFMMEMQSDLKDIDKD